MYFILSECRECICRMKTTDSYSCRNKGIEKKWQIKVSEQLLWSKLISENT